MGTAGHQVQLEEDGGSSTGQSWMETSSPWPLLHWERQGLSQVMLEPDADWPYNVKKFPISQF